MSIKTKRLPPVILLIFVTIFIQPTSAMPPLLKDTSAFSKSIEDYCRLLHLPALAVGVAEGDSLIYFKSVGAVGADDIFPIASLTKSFTAVALKQMEGEGKLSLQDPISKYPNQYFTPDRWTPQTTLGHLISHTSESNPPGSQFIYNGSKFNIVFNAFSTINKTRDSNDMTRPFTEEIQDRILTPLKMTHTLLRFSENEHGHLRKWLVPVYHLDETTGKFQSAGLNPVGMQSGPGFGMMSTVNDLVKYSSALSRHKLLTDQQYRQLTTAFYPGSAYGEGWFTTRFEGIDIHWAYGYGGNDAALLLRVPSKNLTLVMLAPCSLPSATTRLGYGNPFNAMLVCAFFRNFIPEKTKSPGFTVQEKFARLATLSFSPTCFHLDTVKTQELLLELMTGFPSDAIWQTPTAFELVSNSWNPAILDFGLKMADQYARSAKPHPAKAWYAGLIYQKKGRPEKAVSCYEWLAGGDQYNEQSYKFDAMMELAKWYKDTNTLYCRQILQRMIRFKEYININDRQYSTAKEMLAQLTQR